MMLRPSQITLAITGLYPELPGKKTVRQPWQMPLLALISVVMIFGFPGVSPVHAQKLKIRQIDTPLFKTATKPFPGQLPLSRIAMGKRNISRAWFAGPTSRYDHGILGDAIEASQLVVETPSGRRIVAQLPPDRVFEDLEPRLVDLTGDSTDEILVIESHLKQGASLAVYGLAKDALVPMAATPFLGQAHRWLNPVGVGDFDGDGAADVALVATPHIGGILRLYRLNGNRLSLFSEYAGVSTHHIGSTELGLGCVVSARPRDLILVPDQARRQLLLLGWTPKGFQEQGHAELPGALETSLVPVGPHQWRFQVDTGTSYEVFVVQ